MSSCLQKKPKVFFDKAKLFELKELLKKKTTFFQRTYGYQKNYVFLKEPKSKAFSKNLRFFEPKKRRFFERLDNLRFL